MFVMLSIVNILFLLPKRAPSKSLDTNSSRQLWFNGRHELVYIPLLELRSGRVLSLAAADSGVDVSCLYSVGVLLYMCRIIWYMFRLDIIIMIIIIISSSSGSSIML